MGKRQPPAQLHSLGEAYLSVRVCTCAVCAGALDAEDARYDWDADARTLTLEAVCRRCEAPFERVFEAAGVPAAELKLLEAPRLAGPWELEAAQLNPTDEPSQVIDVAGWLTLCTWVSDEARLATEQGRDPAGRSLARRMRLVAGACLEEALKFFDEDNDLPPDEAFFGAEAKRQFWERPELFTRQHIANLRFSLVKGT
jgi:hypothetical protein